MPGPENSKTQFTDVLARMSSHLDGLAGQVFSLEILIGQNIPGRSTGSEQTIVQLQTLDYLRQSLEDLALLTHFLQDHATDGWSAAIPVQSLSTKLRLQSTQHLLKGEAPTEFDAMNLKSGELDLF